MGSGKIYRCSQCGYEGTWGKSWQWFGSYALLETWPQAVPVLCSDECVATFQQRMDTGEVRVAEVRLRGPNGYKITGHPKGYELAEIV